MHPKFMAAAASEAEKEGVKLTVKRAAVLEVLVGLDKPASAYQVVDAYRQKTGDNIAPMSAYRMLDLLVDVGIAHKLKSINKYVACAHLCCDHQHGVSQFLICTECDEVSETTLSDTLMASLEASVASNGFNLNKHQLELHGQCEACTTRVKQ